MTPRPALHLPLNGSLAGTAANVAYTATGNGALRYRDADLGGRQCALVEEAGTNLNTNPVLSANSTGWSAAGGQITHTRTSSLPSALFDELASITTGLEATNGGADYSSSWFMNFVVNSATLSAEAHTATVYAYFPASWAVSGILLRTDTGQYAGASLPSDIDLASANRDTWFRTPAYTFTPDAGDLTGFVYLRAGSPVGTWGTGQSVYLTGSQIEAKDHATTLIPEFNVGGSLKTGYAWSGTPHASTSTRALTTIEADYTSTIEHIFCRYSEDFGETWATASLTSATTFGSYASFDLTANVLTIESSRALMVRDVAVYDVELLPVHQEQIIAAIDAGTFGAGRKPLFVPRGYPVVFVNVRK